MTWLLVVLVFLAAAPAPSAQMVALTITGILTITSPLWLEAVPVVKRLTGAQMTAASYAAALLIAVLASYLAGDLTLDRAGALAVLGGSAPVWTIQQLVYAGLKQWAPTLVGVTPAAAPPKPTV